MNAAMRTLAERGVDLLDRGASAVVIVAACGMTSVVFTQVVLRYGFNLSLDWAEEVARLFFVWLMFLAVPLGVKSGAHIGVELIVNKFPALPREVLLRAMAALSALLMSVVCWHAASLAVDQWDENLPTLELSVGWFMLPVAIGAGHSILHLAGIVLRGAPRPSGMSAE
jgi:TRAP-type C4-dicarboxylate transport system permease small subunit